MFWKSPAGLALTFPGSTQGSHLPDRAELGRRDVCFMWDLVPATFLRSITRTPVSGYGSVQSVEWRGWIGWKKSYWLRTRVSEKHLSPSTHPKHSWAGNPVSSAAMTNGETLNKNYMNDVNCERMEIMIYLSWRRMLIANHTQKIFLVSIIRNNPLWSNPHTTKTSYIGNCDLSTLRPGLVFFNCSHKPQLC